MVGFVFVALLGCVGLMGCGPQESSPALTSDPEGHDHTGAGGAKLTVAAAADLRFALPELVSAFTAENPGVEVTVSYGSSGNFYAQLCNGAPFDVLFSADSDYPRKLIEQGHAQAESLTVYGRGRLVLWVSANSPLEPAQTGMATLSDPAVRRVAIANPRHAPYGRIAEEALKRAGMFTMVQDRLVMGENIAQTAQYVDSGNADVGFIALALAVSPNMNGRGRYWLVPEELHSRLEQAAVVTRIARDRELAGRFVAFTQTPAGRSILKRFGLL